MSLSGTGPLVSATWAPTGSALAVVRSNCLYYMELPGSARVLQCGDTSVSLASPDPVYSEKIWQDSTCLWFSQQSAFIAFAQFRETERRGAVRSVGLSVVTLETGDVTDIELGVDQR